MCVIGTSGEGSKLFDFRMKGISFWEGEIHLLLDDILIVIFKYISMSIYDEKTNNHILTFQ